MKGRYDPKPLLVVHPDAATPEVRRTLQRAGYAIVVSDQPHLFTALDVVSFGTSQMLGRVALETIAKHKSIYQKELREEFARAVFREIGATE